MPSDTYPPEDRKRCIEDARRLRAEAQASCRNARTTRKKAAQTRNVCAITRNRAEEICLDVGLKVWLLQMVRQVIQERQQAGKPLVMRRKGRRSAPSPLPVSPDSQAWEQFRRLSPQTACIQ